VANLLWYPAVCCGGETHSLLNADQPDVLRGLRMAGITLLWHPLLCDGPQPDLAEVAERCLTGATELDILVVEGAVSLVPGDAVAARLAALAARARYVVAAGTCASFGGVMTCGAQGKDWGGLQQRRDRPGGLLGEGFVATGGLPVVNVPGCPAHPDWLTCTLAELAHGKLSRADLDGFGRPRAFFSKLAHHACPRNEFYEFKSSAEQYGQQGCLFENLGCKGTQCESDCNLRLWLGRTGSCPRGGFPCVSCTSPVFPDGFTPFFETQKIGGIPTTLPLDVPKAWYVGISGLAKLACPERLRRSAVADTAEPPAAEGPHGRADR
jgi:Ni,Fe-hydrogenase I small subunit